MEYNQRWRRPVGGWYGRWFRSKWRTRRRPDGSGFIFTEESYNNGYTSSSYTGGAWRLGSNYYLEDGAYTIAGDSQIPTPDKTGTTIGNSGHGFARITILGEEIEEAGIMQMFSVSEQEPEVSEEAESQEIIFNEEEITGDIIEGLEGTTLEQEKKLEAILPEKYDEYITE